MNNILYEYDRLSKVKDDVGFKVQVKLIAEENNKWEEVNEF